MHGDDDGVYADRVHERARRRRLCENRIKIFAIHDLFMIEVSSGCVALRFNPRIAFPGNLQLRVEGKGLVDLIFYYGREED